MPTNAPKVCRGGDRCFPQTLAEAFDCVAHHSVSREGRPLSVREIASGLNVDENRLRKEVSLFYDGQSPKADLIEGITRVTGNLAILDYLERAAGRLAFPLPTSLADPKADVFALATKAMTEFAEFLQQVSSRLADGHASPEDVARITRDGHEAMQLIAHLIEASVSRGVR